MSTKLYNPKRHAYINSSYDYIVSANIKEYDMKSAGLNILIAKKAIDEKTINYLKSLPPKKRKVTEGMMQRKNRELSKVINAGLEEYRSKFIEDNNIEDRDIVSVKRDAIFLVNKKITVNKYDGNIEFRPKNSYSSYYRVSRGLIKLEFYYNKRDSILDIKGIDTERTKEFKHHEKYMIKFLKKLFKLNEVSRKSACEFLKQFADDYRKLKLPIGYYREFNSFSLYRLNMSPIAGNDVAIDAKDDKRLLNITYNYIYIIMPLIKMLF